MKINLLKNLNLNKGNSETRRAAQDVDAQVPPMTEPRGDAHQVPQDAYTPGAERDRELQEMTMPSLNLKRMLHNLVQPGGLG